MATNTALSEKEYARTSFENPDREYRDGELVDRSMPTFNHGETQGDLYARFRSLRPRFAVYPCVETRMKLRPGLYRIPDVAVFFGERPLEVPDTPPLIAIEILSVDDRMSEILEKLQEYHVWGVSHVWLVDPRTRRIYAWESGVREVESLRVPELELILTPDDVFGA